VEFDLSHYGIVLKDYTLSFLIIIIIIIIIIITLSFLFCSQVLCEVEWALESLNATTPEKVAADLSKNWNNSPDNTRLLTQDWGVISLCQTFLGDWTLIVDRLNKKTVCKRPSWISRKKKANSKRTSRAPMSNGPRPLV
jgi:hypothetical protein